MLKWIDIVQIDARGKESSILRVVLSEGVISMKGEPNLLEELEQGISLTAVSTILPNEGVRFLEAVKKQYNSPYLFASEIQEGQTERAFQGSSWEMTA